MTVESADQTQIKTQGAASAEAPKGWRALRLATGIVGDRLVVDLYAALELVTIFLAGLAVAELYVGGRLEVADYYKDYAAPLVALPLIAFAILNRRGAYEFASLCRLANSIGPVASGLASAYAVLVVIGFAAGVANDYSRVWFVGWVVLSTILIIALRAAASRAFTSLADAGLIQKTVAVYGKAAFAVRVAAEVGRARLGIRLAGVFGLDGTDGSAAGDLEDLVAFAQANAVDTIILALPLGDARRINEALDALSVLPCEIKLCASARGTPLPVRGVSMLDRRPLLDVQGRPISERGMIVKAIEDYVVAAAAAILLAPIIAATAIAIRLDSPGPVFFVQRRRGFNHKVIRVLKFRTMRVLEDDEDVTQAKRGDPRVTRVGRILRRTSLDELPQLINVLKGDMSLVGPRPHPVALDARFSGVLARYQNRLRVKPGITGWAQINGYRGPTEDPELMRKRIEFDLEYIDNWSLWLDLKILAATPFLGLIHRNAV